MDAQGCNRTRTAINTGVTFVAGLVGFKPRPEPRPPATAVGDCAERSIRPTLPQTGPNEIEMQACGLARGRRPSLALAISLPDSSRFPGRPPLSHSVAR